MAGNKGFFELLFDFSFSEFIALKVVGVLYGVAMFFAGIGALTFLGGSFQQGFVPGIISLIVTPLGFLLYITLIRIGLEGLIVAFRTAENTGRTAINTEHLRNP